MSEVIVGSNQSLVVRKRTILKAIGVIWGIIILFLMFADVFINHNEWIESGAIQRLVNITRDDGLPNWFSSIQLLFISIVVWFIFLLLKYSSLSLINKKFTIFGWGLIALFFTYLSIDDGSRLHERVGTAFGNSMEARHTHDPGIISGVVDVFPSYYWQIVFVPIFGLVAIFIVIFLIKNLKSKKQIVLIFAAFGCYVTSVFLDYVEGLDESVYQPYADYFETNTYAILHFSKLIEEVCEMIGNTLFMLVFTSQLLNLSEIWNVKLVYSKNKD